MASILSKYLELKGFSPRITRELFNITCSCRHTPTLAHFSLSKRTSIKPSLRTFRYSSFRVLNAGSAAVGGELQLQSPLSALSRKISRRTPTTKAKEGFFPEVSHKVVAYWLLGSAVSVFGIVVFGGLTRLTESGCVRPWPHVLFLLI